VEEGAARPSHAGGDLYFHRPRAPVLELWQRSASSASSAPTTCFRRSDRHRDDLRPLDRGICAHCTVRVFEECKRLPPPVAPIA
jgi:SulP family sulfate permease